MTKGSIAAGATLAVIALTLAALARGLPADTFSVGDPGVKLIATHNAIERPGAPFEIPFPSINGEPLPYLDPFYAGHDDHAHAVTPELFPLLSAPFVAAVGVRGGTSFRPADFCSRLPLARGLPSCSTAAAIRRW